VPYIKSFCRANKMSWINKLLDPLNVAVLKSLLRCKDETHSQQQGSNSIWKKIPLDTSVNLNKGTVLLFGFFWSQYLEVFTSMQRWGWDNSLCFNRGFDSLHLTTEIYSIKCTYLYLKFIFSHVDHSYTLLIHFSLST
jgi:hypothetical protein